MHTATRITIRSTPQEIFAVVSDLERWPERLPHYRYVRPVECQRPLTVFAMSAMRGCIPVSWVSSYWNDSKTMELHFEHLQKWTKGMEVIWKLNETRDGTRVEIVHDLAFRFRPLAWLAEPIISSFVAAIAGKTLQCFKEHIEAKAGVSAPDPEAKPVVG